MERFFSQKHCDRCGSDLKNGRTMSTYNTQCICMVCKEKETMRPDYHEAVKTEHAEIKKGNYNYKGIKG